MGDEREVEVEVEVEVENEIEDRNLSFQGQKKSRIRPGKQSQTENSIFRRKRREKIL
jgi:hypothetical protein